MSEIKPEENDNQDDTVRCRRCGSTQLMPHKKGFDSKKAAVGCLLFGGLGLAGGMIGSNKIKLCCLKCGEVFDPGDGPLTDQESEPPALLPETEEMQQGAMKSALAALGIIVLAIFGMVLFSWISDRQEQGDPSKVIKVGPGYIPPKNAAEVADQSRFESDSPQRTTTPSPKVEAELDDPRRELGDKPIDKATDPEQKKFDKDVQEFQEHLAAAKLKNAEILLKAGKTDVSRKLLRELVEKYPNTEAGAKAKTLLNQ